MTQCTHPSTGQSCAVFTGRWRDIADHVVFHNLTLSQTHPQQGRTRLSSALRDQHKEMWLVTILQ